MEKLSELYVIWSGSAPTSVTPLAKAGSNRSYYRLEGPGGSCIGVHGTSLIENRAFIYLATHFAGQGLSVPQVYLVSSPELLPGVESAEYYLQEDLGMVSLFDALQEGRRKGGDYNLKEKKLLHQVMAYLPKLQYEGAKDLDFSYCYPQPEFDAMTVMLDLHYFKYCFLKTTGVEFEEIRLEEEFQHLAQALAQVPTDTFLYRDFQARNVMLKEGKPYFIDFQGGRKGPVHYDVASFLWQAKAYYPDSLRDELIDTYLQHLAIYTPVNGVLFRKQLKLFILLRILQVLGAYGYRGYFERKPHFLKSIPAALDNLKALLREGDLGCPYLAFVLRTMVDSLQCTPSPNHTSGRLVVRIFSFSYKKGIPEDVSGNGGGYVFDCRSIHNPGRYEPYKKLTGLDEPVIRFLKEDGEIFTFLDSVYKLADMHVERYLERGFTDLMFSFGCTGGQHRSVYSAQHLAEHLSERYGIEVCVCHREQGIQAEFPRKDDVSANPLNQPEV